MGRGGVKARKLTTEEIEVLKYWSGHKLPIKDIATFFKMPDGKQMSEDTLERILKKDETARAGRLAGVASVRAQARQILLELAFGVKDKKTKQWITKPSLSALKYWLETQEEFKRTDHIELTGTVQSVSAAQVKAAMLKAESDY